MAKRADEYRNEGHRCGVEDTQVMIYNAIHDVLDQSQVGRRYLQRLSALSIGGRIRSHEVKILLAEMVVDLTRQQEWIAELNMKADKLRQFEAAQGALVSSLGALLAVGSAALAPIVRDSILLKSLGGAAADKIRTIKAVREITSFGLMSDIGDAEAPSVLWEETKDVVDSVAAGTPATLKPLDTADKQKWYENATRILRDLGCIFE